MSSPDNRSGGDDRLLSVADSDRLAELEEVIGRGMQTFVEVGAALCEIREQRLYRARHATFEDYCRERWGFTASRARQIVSAYKVVTDVTVGGLPAPASEAQARVLAPFRREPERAREIWGRAVAAHGSHPTADQIRQQIAAPSAQPTAYGAAARPTEDRLTDLAKVDRLVTLLREAEGLLQQVAGRLSSEDKLLLQSAIHHVLGAADEAGCWRRFAPRDEP